MNKCLRETGQQGCSPPDHREDCPANPYRRISVLEARIRELEKRARDPECTWDNCECIRYH